MVSNSGMQSLSQAVALSETTTAAFLVRAGAWLLTCSERRRQRYALAGLNDHLLADLGLLRSDVSREADRWPWQA